MACAYHQAFMQDASRTGSLSVQVFSFSSFSRSRFLCHSLLAYPCSSLAVHIHPRTLQISILFPPSCLIVTTHRYITTHPTQQTRDNTNTPALLYSLTIPPPTSTFVPHQASLPTAHSILSPLLLIILLLIILLLILLLLILHTSLSYLISFNIIVFVFVLITVSPHC